MIDLLVIAKAPQPGGSKTRLCPPFSYEQAASLAEAALVDTLHAVAAVPSERRVLVLDGEPGSWLDDGFRVLAQRGAGLDVRLASAFEDAHDGRPMLLIGMDTPQIKPSQLQHAAGLMREGGAVLGEALDGGWWAIGLQEPRREIFEGVPMSTPDTGRLQRKRLEELGIRFTSLEVLRDIDTAEDAHAVAEEHPQLRFSKMLESMNGRSGRNRRPG